MDPLEHRLREGLQDDRWRLEAAPDVLARVHEGAARRRQRRATVRGLAAAAVLVAGGAGGIGYVVNGSGPGTLGTAAGGSAEQAHEERSGASEDQGADGQAEPKAAPQDGPDSANEGARQPPPGTLADTTVPAGFSPVSMTAMSPDTYWLLGAGDSQGRVTSGSGAVVVGTKNAGATFGRLSGFDATVVRGADETTLSTVTGLRFTAGGRDGWAYGGGLWSTHDAGGSFNRVAAGPRPGLVERVETAGGFAYALVHEGDVWSLWRTPSDHDSWQRLGAELHQPAALSVTSRLVVVTDQTAGGTHALVSADGGKSFIRRPSPCTADLGAGDLSATVDGLWLTCATGTSATLHVSTDDGKSWTKVPTDTPAFSTAAAEVAARGGAEAIVATPGRALLVGPGGSTRTPVPGLDQPTFASFTTTQVGYILDVKGQLFRTTDGGASWGLVRVD